MKSPTLYPSLGMRSQDGRSAQGEAKVDLILALGPTGSLVIITIHTAGAHPHRGETPCIHLPQFSKGEELRSAKLRRDHGIAENPPLELQNIVDQLPLAGNHDPLRAHIIRETLVDELLGGVAPLANAYLKTLEPGTGHNVVERRKCRSRLRRACTGFGLKVENRVDRMGAQ